MNNRGQVLSFFVLMLPIITIILILIIDISNLVINKLDIDNINRILLDYSLDNIDNPNVSNKLKDLALLNDDKLEIVINNENDKINITLSKELKGIIIKKNIYNIKSHFIGYLDNEKKIIKRIKGDGNE